MSVSAVYWLSIIPENIPAPLVRNAGSPTLRAGFVSRLSRRSERTQTIVTAAPDHLHGQGDRRPLEVRAGQRHALVRQEDRVVGDAVELDLDLGAGEHHRVVRRADDLGRGAHRVGVLHLGVDPTRRQVAAIDAAADGLGAPHRAREAAQLVEPRRRMA